MKKVLLFATLAILATVGASAQVSKVEHNGEFYAGKTFRVEKIKGDYYMLLPNIKQTGTKLRMPLLYYIAPVEWSRTERDWTDCMEIKLGATIDEMTTTITAIQQWANSPKRTKGQTVRMEIGGESYVFELIKKNKLKVRHGERLSGKIKADELQSLYSKLTNELKAQPLSSATQGK